MESAVLLWGGSALPGGVGAAAADAGEAKGACGLLHEDAGACILPWKVEPTPYPSCLPGGVGDAEAEGVSFLTEGGGGARAGDSVSADLLLLLLLLPLPDPEGLPVEEEGLESLSMLLAVPDMRSQMLMGPAQREGGGGVDPTTQVMHTHCKR